MLTPERIPFIVFTVPPILLLIVIFSTRPAARRLLGASLMPSRMLALPHFPYSKHYSAKLRCKGLAIKAG